MKKYKLLVDGKQIIPCEDQMLSDILYTARTLSKYGNCQVDVYKRSKSICTFHYGKEISRIAV